MKAKLKWRWGAAILVALLLICGFAFYFRHSDEPVFEGKSLTEWLYQYDENGDVRGQSNCVRAIRAIGTNGFPIYFELLQTRKSSQARRLEGFAFRSGWRTFRITYAEKKRLLADRGFRVLGKEAKSATPQLIELIEKSHPDAILDILLCLMSIEAPKDQVLPVLKRLIKHSDFNARFMTAIYVTQRFPEEAEKLGVYEKFPDMNPAATNAARNGFQ